MAAARRMTREEEYLKKKDLFRRNAFIVIQEMVHLSGKGHNVLVDEILHSIFFLGELSNPKYAPKDIVTDDNMLNMLKGRYPGPFQHYASKLPRRSPISCVLDMIVLLHGQKDETQIIKQLHDLILQLVKDEATDLVSSTICVSQPNNTKTSDRHYGVSMSSSGPLPGRIMVAASCLSYWDSYVAGAVMTYYPIKKKKDYFDGTIKLPKQVRCQAFSLTRESEMPPCRSCGNLFGLLTTSTQEWPYGNCAEPESVSNMLKKEKEVREQARPKAPSCTEENRKRAEDSVRKDLDGFLKTLKFRWDKTFYTPQ